jgi:tetratricopeptide (TPR) repeat protein
MTSAPESLNSLMDRATAAVAAENLALAAQLWTEICRQAPDNAGARRNLGCVLTELGQFEAAENHLAHAHTLEPGIKSLRRLYELHFLTRRFDKVEDMIGQLLKLQPDSGDLYLMLAKIRGSRGDEAGAADVLNRGRHAAPHDLNFAVAYIDLVQRDDLAAAERELGRLQRDVAADPAKAKIVLRTIANHRARAARKTQGQPAHTTVSWEDTCRWSEPESLRHLAGHLRENLVGAHAAANTADLGYCAITEMNWDAAEDLLRKTRGHIFGTAADVIMLDMAAYEELQRYDDAMIDAGLVDVVTVKPLPADARTTIFLGSDPVYFERFTLPLMRSFRMHNASLHLHAHLLDGEPNLWERLSALAAEAAGPRVSMSAEQSNAGGSKLYYASVRYIRAYQHLKVHGRPLWVMDVDTTVNRDPAESFGNLAAFDIALWGCPDWLEPWNKVQASLVGLMPTAQGLNFSRLVAAFIAAWHRVGGLRWCTDQAALFGVYAYLHRLRRSPRMLFLDPGVVSVTAEPDSAIHVNRGIQKFVV